MQATKENKVYTITEQEKAQYLKDGYDIILDNGKKEPSPLTKISLAEHEKKVKEKDAKIAALETELEALKTPKSVSKMNGTELKEYAEKQAYDIPQEVKTVEEIRAFIKDLEAK